MNNELHDIAMLALSKKSINFTGSEDLAKRLYVEYNKIMNVLEDLEERDNTPIQGISFGLKVKSGHTIEEAIEEVKRVLPPKSNVIIHSDEGDGQYNIQINSSRQLTSKEMTKIIKSESRFFNQV